MLQVLPYDREAAVRYAHQWAYGRNPKFFDFSGLGGDCTNFASQCLLAGGHGIMNETPTFGWYYHSAADRAAAWTGVTYLYNFLTANKGAAVFGSETSIREIEPGDLVQLAVESNRYHHCPVVIEVRQGGARTQDDIWVAAHSFDADCRPLASYMARRVRFIHIEGVRVPVCAAETESGPA